MRTGGRIIPGGFVAVAVAALVLALPQARGSAGEAACVPTSPDSLGPFYKANAPERSSTGRGLLVTGTVRSASGCGSVPGVQIEWWSVNPRGSYDDDHRATQRADPEGRYRYETDFPVRYFGRPPHVHVRVTAPAHRTLVTQLYPTPGQTTLTADFVLIPD